MLRIWTCHFILKLRVNCTLYTVHFYTFTLYTVHCILYTVHCTVSFKIKPSYYLIKAPVQNWAAQPPYILKIVFLLLSCLFLSRSFEIFLFCFRIYLLCSLVFLLLFCVCVVFLFVLFLISCFCSCVFFYFFLFCFWLESRKFVVRFWLHWKPPEGIQFHWRDLKNRVIFLFVFIFVFVICYLLIPY